LFKPVVSRLQKGFSFWSLPVELSYQANQRDAAGLPSAHFSVSIYFSVRHGTCDTRLLTIFKIKVNICPAHKRLWLTPHNAFDISRDNGSLCCTVFVLNMSLCCKWRHDDDIENIKGTFLYIHSIIFAFYNKKYKLKWFHVVAFLWHLQYYKYFRCMNLCSSNVSIKHNIIIVSVWSLAMLAIIFIF